MRREGQWVRRLAADGLQARGGIRAVWPDEGPRSRDRMRWEHRDTRFGEAAAPRGVDRAQRSVVTRQGTDGHGLGPGGAGLVVCPVRGLGVGGRGSVRAASDGGRVESHD